MNSPDLRPESFFIYRNAHPEGEEVVAELRRREGESGADHHTRAVRWCIDQGFSAAQVTVDYFPPTSRAPRRVFFDPSQLQVVR